MVCEVCRAGPEGVTELGALWASEGTNYLEKLKAEIALMGARVPPAPHRYSRSAASTTQVRRETRLRYL
jgi:hypothetical protein